MSRYVDAEWLIKESMPLNFSVQKWVNEVQIMTAPSIDIVRCGECEYWKESQYYPEFMVCTYVKGTTFTRQHDDFCSRGEREGE